MSSTTSTEFRGHPITVAAAQLHDLFDEVAEAATWSLSDEETRESLVAITRARARLTELELRVAAHAETTRVGDATGATSTAAWWAAQTKSTRAQAHRDVKLAGALDTDRHQPLREALAAGRVLAEQAAVIVHAVDALPDDAPGWVPAKAEAMLVGHAADHDARELRVLGKRILAVIDPAAADAHEAKVLEAEEQAAREAASFRMVDDGYGQCHGKFRVPAAHGEMLRKALMAIAAPKHQAAATHGSAHDRDIPTPHKLGLAFMDYIERYPTDHIPHAGGVAATVVVTVDHDVLTGELEKAGVLDTGARISPAECRRLACAAAIIPAVMGGRSQVRDLGRKRRFHSEPQRIAAGIEQGGCTAEGCDWPPGMCHLHHPTAWSKGGGTNRDGRMLCPPPPHPRPRHPLRDDHPPHRQGRLPPTNVGRRRPQPARAESAGHCLRRRAWAPDQVSCATRSAPSGVRSTQQTLSPIRSFARRGSLSTSPVY